MDYTGQIVFRKKKGDRQSNQVIKMSIILVVFVSLPFLSFSQSLSVSNVHYRIFEGRIDVFYDLPVNTDSLRVELTFYKKSSPGFYYTPMHIAGDAGTGRFSGKNKMISWYIEKEPKNFFTGQGFYFKVRAIVIPRKLPPDSLNFDE